MICITCGSTEFSVEGGIFYCIECSTQIEKSLDEQTEDISFSRKNLVSSPSAERSHKEKENIKYSSWITVEAYNFILCQQVNALIELGSSPKLKPTVLHIWTKYLEKCEIAFRKDYRADEVEPRLGPLPVKRDLKVLFGDQTLFKKKSRKRSKVDSGRESDVSGESEESGQSDCPISDSDDPISHSDSNDSSSKSTSSSKSSNSKYSSRIRKLRHKSESLWKSKLKKQVIQKYEDSVCNMNLKKTLSFCYLGLLYTEDQLTLTDLIRLAYEERIPYLNVPEKLLDCLDLQHSDFPTFLAYTVPDAAVIHKTSYEIAKFLNLPKHNKPPIHLAVSCFLKEFNLPADIKPMVKVMHDEFVEKMRNYSFLDDIPTDQLALSFIIVVLKALVILDGKFEIDHSQVMIKLNSIKPGHNFFVWTEWKKQALLKEFLFLAEKPGYCAINKFDSLSADRIIAKYPYIQLKPPSTEDTEKCRNDAASMNEIKDILSSIVNISSNSESMPTSFPTRSEINNFSKEWETLPMFRETKEIDFTLLKKDFSSHSLSYNPLQYDPEEDELSYLLMTSLYLPDTLIKTTSKLAVCQNKSIITSSKYWFYYTSRRTKADCEIVDFEDKVPSSFKWLINFMCKCSFMEVTDIYLLVLEIEKVLFLGRKYVKPHILPSLCNKLIVD